jgi:hypothetical protein
MPDLGGFEVVGQLTEAVLNEILKSAWDNDIIPHSTPIPAGTAFGPYQVADGVVNIARDTLHLAMDVPANGVRITLPAEIQVEIANPPVPSARLFDMTADLVARVSIGVIPDTIQVAAMLAGIPAGNVSAQLTSGDPVPALTTTLIAEYIHARYQDNTIPNTITEEDVSLGFGFSGDVFMQIFDDASDASRRIEVTQPDASSVKISLPFYLRVSDMSAPAGPQPLSPMGITGRIVITADLQQAPGSLTVRLASGDLEIEDVAPAPGTEGSNYTTNKAGASSFGIDLEEQLKANMRARGQAILAALGDQTFMVPTVAQLEAFIASQAHAAITGRGDIALWTPTPPPGGDVTVTDVKPVALPDAIAFCLNNPAGNTDVIVNFIPASRTCAIAIDGAKVVQIIRDQINKPEDEGGLGGLPHTVEDVNGHDAVVTRIDVSLVAGAIRVSGDVTVKDAIAGSIDVDASFSANVGLRWEDNPDGTQRIEPFVIGEPDVDLSLLAWILSFLIGFITLGLVGGIIALVVMNIAEGIAEKIGGSIIRDEITGQVKGIGAWPQDLEGIGEVTSRFENPVLIDPQSVMFPDAYLVTAIFAHTVIAFADSGGPYVVNAGAPVTFTGGPVAVDTDYQWAFGDGATAANRVATHTYGDNGIYVAKLQTTVNQPGGVVTRQFARVHARNVPPVVDAGPDITIDEGEEIEFIAEFHDQEWLDTHRAIFHFGDDTLPVSGEVSQTNDPPRAEGTARAKHAYCDNGRYTVTVQIHDDDGGVGSDQRIVTVRNVPPEVDAGDDMFAYLDIPITLEACFRDPGWCDTHVATIDVGDCTPVLPAVVRQTNDPPAAIGVAAVTHIYRCCGTYLVRFTVTDDDGGVGTDTLHVRVVSLQNPGFEEGFRNRWVGTVGNGWEPYVITDATSAPPTHVGGGAGQIFEAEEFVVHGGQRSQRIGASGRFRAGIYQRIGANPGWDYQVSAWYHLDERAGGACRLGIDPQGGIDPNASSVVWAQGSEQRDWAQLLERVTAEARRITIFLETHSQEQAAAGYWDDVLLLPHPCPLKICEPEAPPEPEEKRLCVDWRDEREPRTLGRHYQKSGFTFTSLTTLPMMIALWGVPQNQGKLQFPGRGIRIAFPFEANRVVAQLAVYTGQPVRMRAFGPDGNLLGEATTPQDSQGSLTSLEIQAEGMTSLDLIGGGNEALLVELCIYQTPRSEPPAPPNRGIPGVRPDIREE